MKALILATVLPLVGCTSTSTYIGTDTYGQQYSEIKEQRFLMQTSGKSNSATKDGDSWLVEFKSDSEQGDGDFIQAVAAGVAAGMRAAALPQSIPFQ